MYCTEHCTYDLIRWNTGKCTANGESSAPSVFVVHCLDNILSLIPVSKISSKSL